MVYDVTLHSVSTFCSLYLCDSFNQGWAGNDLSAFPFLAFAVAGNGRFFWLPVEQNFGCRQQNCCRSLLILVAGNKTIAGHF